jgi:lantibiotic leader peptide-processing serine protease
MYMSARIWRATIVGGLAVATVAGAGTAVAQGRTTAAPSGSNQVAQATANEYVVLASDASTVAAAEAAVQRAGGQVTMVNTDVGLLTVESTNSAFVDAVRADGSVEGVARNRPIGEGPVTAPARKDGEKLSAEERATVAAAHAASATQVSAEPLADKQWDMAMIGATPDGSYAINQGSHDVLVGIIDTGVDSSHPDIAPNFNRQLSRNFAPDIPDIDGPCEVASCLDPVGTDDGGHGTHVAGTVAAALNGVGISGVAPGVQLVELKAGQDSGFFFLQPTIDAITFAGRKGIDVVNMSFFTDPWLYNCADNPADSPEEQLEQRTIIKATQRAANFARDHGVTLVAALGNEHTDLGNPTIDTTSPDFPPGTEKTRTVNNTCLDVPTETRGVISVSALGPSKGKADYSNYGIEQTDFSAPGGYFRDFFGTPQFRNIENTVLSAWPKNVAIEEGSVDPTTGQPLIPDVVASCTGATIDTCTYWRWLQGTSMASPHAAGVAALVVSAHGRKDRANGGLTLRPDKVEDIMKATATRTPCPDPPLVDYLDEGRDASFTALCVGTARKNGFYGRGIVNAVGAVS